MKTAKQLLNQLVDQYENSIVSKGGTTRQIRQRIRFTPTLLPKYFAIDGYRMRRELNEELFIYQQRKWIEIDYDEEYDEIHTITLCYDKLDEIYRELKRKSQASLDQSYLELFQAYAYEESLKPYVEEVLSRIQNYKSYKSLVYDDLDKTKACLMALSALFKQEKEISERIFSVRVLKDSKLFATMKPKLAMILKTCYDAEDVDVDELMAEYNIMRNPTHVYLKGKGSFKIGTTLIHLTDFKDGFALSSADIKRLEWIDLSFKQVISIENLTSFYEVSKPDTLFVYLGGFHNRLRRSLFIQLKELVDCPFYHFGDIDAGGFNIFKHLCVKTNIEFIPLHMDIQTLEEYKDCCIPLTQEDQKRLALFQSNNTIFYDEITWMLKHKKKLEQEHVEMATNEYECVEN